MQSFKHDGFELSFIDEGQGDPILLIHGFASTHYVNWVAPGWVKTLRDAGFRVIALDNRGHGRSTKSHDEAVYTPRKMAGDAAALLDHLDIPKAHVMGYSMGARISAFLALEHPSKVATLILGGLGLGMIEGVGEWDEIAEALLTDDPDTIASERGQMFRKFADQTKSDRRALAACIATSRELLTEQDAARIAVPTLVAVGTRDDIAGSPEGLADLLPNGVAFAIERRDHMLAVGDRTFKARALAFLEEHPLDRT
ncbi:alpha/beta hydrolase [Nitratireductor rhodophyticola]|uniref:Alpha/beta hydrolase n=1 Tax=Nitratireductor rhodophyticola TaxID=2854036 RepID=A0ABS7R3B5_9HYPH|nr:alpha/beta hydrolase [Nitratireductor rhodophyticola]MBY8915439.1 alpha/beta hydrolase [Nitratireductor rhodophyticola]MBY8919492.1 alpha/beta hydrolase [Nitratireductor rhodophyticola]MEC9244128.1 alpha/beta hydrolase [Pseudomonadota bacterium]WPZ13434.1 alpha/beta hydrolase [Nitratireductor rhodophyticola]